jgi:alanyl-tRNA synthetase
MKAFSLISEEAISKGIRRIVAITGPDAERVSDILLLPRNEAHLI